MNFIALFSYTRPELPSDTGRRGPLIGSTGGEGVISARSFSRRRSTLLPVVMPGCLITTGSRRNLGRAWVSMLLIATLPGCAARSQPKSFLPTVNIPVECATSIHLVNCDLSVSPPLCGATAITYHKGCEQIMVVK
jgi:hypothetical protein